MQKLRQSSLFGLFGIAIALGTTLVWKTLGPALPDGFEYFSIVIWPTSGLFFQMHGGGLRGFVQDMDGLEGAIKLAITALLNGFLYAIMFSMARLTVRFAKWALKANN